ncbi:MAG: RNA-binding protein [Methylococcales bacterium]|nr:RNA-binding protein [Methylococcales bacterium]
MIIFFRNIPPETKKYEIASFINRVSNSHFIIAITDIEILTIQDSNSKTLETHGLIRILQKEEGKRAIKLIDGKIFKGNRITVREYFIRSEHNDPRNKHLITPIEFKEQRCSDRRRTVDKNIHVYRY